MSNKLIKVQMVSLGWLSVLFFVACKKEQINTSTNKEQRTPAEKLITAPNHFPAIPFPDDNQFTIEKWQLGKKLFYEKAFSIDSSISCASCHKQSLSFADDVAFSKGAFNRLGVRNAPSLANIAYHPYFLREGSVPTLEMQVLVPIQEEIEFAHDILNIAELLKSDSNYVNLSIAAFGKEPDAFVITRALATFERTLVSGNSPYDLFLQGKFNLSTNQKKGMELFFSEKTNCFSCHEGFNFTDYGFANNGLYAEYVDDGRYRFTGLDEDRALFKTPSLRNVLLTAPYMHDGSVLSLEEVIEHYNSGGKEHPNKSTLVKPLNLTELEKKQLVDFLKTLTDADFINDPNFSK